MIKRWTLYIIIIIPTLVFSQVQDSINANQQFQQQIEGISEKSNDNKDFSEIAETLDYLHSNKINLNSASAEDLKQLSILDIFQINNFLNYRRRNGDIFSIYELNSIHGFDEKIVRSIIPYIKVEPVEKDSWSFNDFGKIMKYGKNRIITRVQTQLQTPEGYLSESDSIEPKYLGDKYKLYTKYLFNSKDKIRFGITLENDAGEKFGGEQSLLGFDFSSFHLEIKNAGIFNKLIIGDYNIEFGQGLALWSSFSTNKSSDATNIVKLGRGIVPFSGTNENVFFRGIASTVSLGKFKISPFISHNLIDASINTDNTEEYNTYETGLHRTESEIMKKNSLTKIDYGANIDYNLETARISITAINTTFNHKLAKGNSDYQLFNFDDNTSTTLSAHYLWSMNSIILSGEHASNTNGKWATIHNISVNTIPEFNFVISYRNYQKDFFSPTNSPFSEYSSSGEKGYYFGVKGEIHRYLKLSAYIDVFEKTWLQYQKDAPSKGYEALLQLDSEINRSTTAYFRIKYEKKSRNIMDDENFLNKLKNEKKLNIRLQFYKILGSGFSIASRAECVNYFHNTTEKGWLIYQDIKWKSRKKAFSIFSRIAFFDTDGWNSRIYAYENDILYIFTVPAYYDKGIKYYLGGKYDLNKKISFWMRLSHTEYENKYFLGNSNDKIYGNQKTEVKLQLRIKF